MASATPGQLELAISAERYGPCVVVQASGRIDHTNAPRFLDVLRREAGTLDTGGGMVIDLAGLAFITSAGLRALMQTKTLLAESEGRLVIAGAAGTVAEVIRIARFDTLLTLAPDAPEGLRLLSPEAAAQYPD